MRDPNRIDPFLQELGTIWKENCPHWRFGQLMFNVNRVMKTHGADIFYFEEDDLLEYMKQWFDVEPKDKHDAARRRRRKTCVYPERLRKLKEEKQ